MGAKSGLSQEGVPYTVLLAELGKVAAGIARFFSEHRKAAHKPGRDRLGFLRRPCRDQWQATAEQARRCLRHQTGPVKGEWQHEPHQARRQASGCPVPPKVQKEINELRPGSGAGKACELTHHLQKLFPLPCLVIGLATPFCLLAVTAFPSVARPKGRKQLEKRAFRFG